MLQASFWWAAFYSFLLAQMPFRFISAVMEFNIDITYVAQQGGYKARVICTPLSSCFFLCRRAILFSLYLYARVFDMGFLFAYFVLITLDEMAKSFLFRASWPSDILTLWDAFADIYFATNYLFDVTCIFLIFQHFTFPRHHFTSPDKTPPQWRAASLQYLKNTRRAMPHFIDFTNRKNILLFRHCYWMPPRNLIR